MDFLEIRRKAKERAAREGAAEPRTEAAPGAPTPGASPAAPPPAPPSTRSTRPAAEPAPKPDEAPAQDPAPAADARFTTWRPGSGERPFVPPPEAPPPPQPAPSDFAVFDPARARGAPTADRSAPAPAPAVRSPQPFAPPVLALGAAVAPLPAARAASPRPRPEEAASYGRRLGEPEPRPAERSTRREVQRPADPLDEFFFRADEEAPILGALPGGEPEPAELRDTETDAGIEEYLTFRLGSEEYGVPIGQVHEVLKAPAITEVPRAPAGILGVVTVRGEVVAVFDPRRRLGLPGAPPGAGDGRIVIVDDGAGSCGLLVDAVASVVRLARRSIEPCPQGIGGASADCLAGIGRERGRLFTVLDLPALLRRAPAPVRRAGEGRAHGAP